MEYPFRKPNGPLRIPYIILPFVCSLLREKIKLLFSHMNMHGVGDSLHHLALKNMQLSKGLIEIAFEGCKNVFNTQNVRLKKKKKFI
jgi:hypothetical protein